MDRPARFGGARRLVVKIGSAVLRDGHDFDRVTFVSLVRDLAALRNAGLEIVVVSSGAVALGMGALGRSRRPVRLAELQATAAIGQGRLMHQWADELGHHRLVAGQVLLTRDDLRDRRRHLAARQTLSALLEMGAIPVINENDTVAFDEIKLGDNDLLSSQVVNLVDAECLVILSDVEALYDRDPRAPGATPLHHVDRIDTALLAAAGGSTSSVGSGGMRTKVEAVRQVTHFGVPALIARGKTHRVMQRLHAGEVLGTWFSPEQVALSARKHWIAYAQPPLGVLTLDTGAVQALVSGKKSLLPIGVTEVDGAFEVGDPVGLIGPDGSEFARGLVSMDAATIRAVLGRRSGEVGALAEIGVTEVIHRDDLVLMPR